MLLFKQYLKTLSEVSKLSLDFFQFSLLFFQQKVKVHRTSLIWFCLDVAACRQLLLDPSKLSLNFLCHLTLFLQGRLQLNFIFAKGINFSLFFCQGLSQALWIGLCFLDGGEKLGFFSMCNGHFHSGVDFPLTLTFER